MVTLPCNPPSKKRVLIVNCYFDDSHTPIRKPRKLPQPIGPVYLAGAFSPARCEMRLYNEVASGPLEDERLLAWPNMLVLTGLTNAFDRMLHLTAYARTKNPGVIVVAGGPPIRALPLLSQRFFDYPCDGDIEQLREVIVDALGPPYVAPQMLPRYDLAYWIRGIGHVEASRYCNFHCSFCSLTGEGHRYLKYPLESVRRQIQVMGRKKHLLFVDNNFYGNDRSQFLARVELAKEMRRAGYYRDWAAIVTNDFFHKDENLERVRDAGCLVLFSGVESFDVGWLRGVNKLQNTRSSPVEQITKCLNAGIMFCYGLMLDVTSRPVIDLRRELDFITGTPEITLPSFLTLAIPLLGTPFFRECLAKGAFLPLTKLRDLDGTTLTMRPLDTMDEAVAFVRDMVAFRGYRGRTARHVLRFMARYRWQLSGVQMAAALTNAALLCADTVATGHFRLNGRGGRGWQRTHLTTTEPLEDVYTPAFRVAARYESHFKPTMVTDEAGDPTREIAEAAALVRVEAAGMSEDLKPSFSVPTGFPLVARARA